MGVIEATEEDYQFLPLDQAAEPYEAGAYMHYTGSWWVVHPDKGLAFWNPVMKRSVRRRSEGLGAPLCNPHEGIQRCMAEAIAAAGGWPAQAVLVESAWVPIKITGYL